MACYMPLASTLGYRQLGLYVCLMREYTAITCGRQMYVALEVLFYLPRLDWTGLHDQTDRRTGPSDI